MTVLAIEGADAITHRRALSGVLVRAVAGALATGSAAAASTGSPEHERLQEVVHRLATVDGRPGALIRVRDRRGDTALAGGVADVPPARRCAATAASGSAA
ncbi:MAG TPA: hypothetical protein VGN37_16570 [Actinocatenispora sp.]